MTEIDFIFLQDFLYRSSGLALGREKLYLIESRLGMLCRKASIDGLPALVTRLRTGCDKALEAQVVEAMTTNETLFFRDMAPFDQLRRVVLPDAIKRNAATRRLRIWCAGVSSGQEAYSVAMLLKEFSRELSGWQVDLLGTDISGEIIDKARSGAYSQFEIQRGLPVTQLLQHFEQQGDLWRIRDELRRMVRFEVFNLLDPMARHGIFDIILCRNVLIYFDMATKARTLRALSDQLDPQGVLLLGATETVIGITECLMPDRTHRGLFRPAPPAATDRTVVAGKPLRRSSP